MIKKDEVSKVMGSIIDLFYQNAAEIPDKVAVWCDESQITYAELAKKVSKYSNLLLKHGVKYGEHIGFPMNNSIESVSILLAAADIGAAIVPINSTLPADAVKSAFESGKVTHMIAQKSFLKKYENWEVPTLTGKLFCIDEIREGSISMLQLEGIKTERPQIEKTGKEILIITLTSGSTGAPKPITLTQEDKYIRACRHIELYKITKDDKVLAATPLYHSLAERLVLMPLMIGATSILLPRFTPNLWLNCVKSQAVTFTIAVSAQLGQIAELLSSPFVPDINSLRCIVSSSALLEAHVRANLIERLDCDFHEMYGTSETSTITNIDFRETKEKRKSVGKPLSGVKLLIIDEFGNECSAGEIGEIACSTPLLCSGYYGMEEQFKKCLRDDYFCTGDLGFLDEEGYLYYFGRKKELIITGGVNVYPVDIEECVGKLIGVEACAAFSYPDERLGEVVAVAVVEKEKGMVSVRDIRVHCAKNLADYQQPHKIYIVDHLPQNTLGKVVKGKLLEMINKL